MTSITQGEQPQPFPEVDVQTEQSGQSGEKD